MNVRIEKERCLLRDGPCWNSGSCCGWNSGSCRGWSSDRCGQCALVRTYIVGASPSFLLHLSYKSFYHTFHQVRSQGVFIEEAFYCIIYSYDRLPRATTSLPSAKVGTTKCNVASLHQWNDPSSTINQQPNATRYCSAVNGMRILCSQWFAQLSTILTYMLLTVMHRTCNVLRRPTISSRTILFHNTYLHPSLIHNRLSLVKTMRIHFYRGLSGTEDDGGGLQWDFISRCWIRYTSLLNFHFHKTSVTSKKSGVLS